MYAVVVFPSSDPDDNEEVNAVPVAWLSPGRDHCSWPPVKGTSAINKAIRERKEPNENWTTHNAKVLKMYG